MKDVVINNHQYESGVVLLICFTVSVSMVGAELYPPVYTNTFCFIMIKYVFGETIIITNTNLTSSSRNLSPQPRASRHPHHQVRPQGPHQSRLQERRQHSEQVHGDDVRGDTERAGPGSGDQLKFKQLTFHHHHSKYKHKGF